MAGLLPAESPSPFADAAPHYDPEYIRHQLFFSPPITRTVKDTSAASAVKVSLLASF